MLATASGEFRYLLGLPPGCRAGSARRWPLILFLHGRGESGTDLNLVKKHGIPRLVEHTDHFPFITVSPQCPAGTDWSAHHGELLGLLDHVVADQPVDGGQIYLTGLSMGGQGTYELALDHPDRFAALAPVCGRIPEAPRFFERLAALRGVPVWVFHGAEDTVVPVGHADRIVAALRTRGVAARYTVYPDAEHDVWERVYAGSELYSWFTDQSRRAAGYTRYKP